MATPVIEPRQQSAERLTQIQRPARALLGWMDHPQAMLIQAGQRTDRSTAEHAQRAERARAAVAARQVGVDQTNVISEVPDNLYEYVDVLRQSGAAAAFFNEGWRVALVDLRKVCALQTHVFTDHAEQRTAEAKPDDLHSLATISLPLPAQAELPAQFDQMKQAWIISAANPNLRITGNWGGPLNPGMVGFGFTISLLPSFLQVACLRDRFLLRDGYHRAIGFLRRGISLVPAFVRDFGPFQDLGLPPGILPQSAYLGERPPVLTDYLDDSLSADVFLPAFQKMIVIHAMELTPIS